MADERIELIPEIVRRMPSKYYLEIGCRHDETFGKVISPHKVGVDPRHGGNIRATSDGFFGYLDNEEPILYTNEWFKRYPDQGRCFGHEDPCEFVGFDVVFIDGDHNADQVHRDIVNSLHYLTKGGCILLHDVLPTHEADQSDHVCGTVWRAAAWAATQPNLKFMTWDMDCGIGAIRIQENQSPFRMSWATCQKLTWDWFQQWKKTILRITPDRDEFLKHCTEPILYV